MTFPMPMPPPMKPAVTVSHVYSSGSTTNAASFTFSASTTGAVRTKKIVVCVGTAGGSPSPDGVSSIKIHVPNVGADPTGTSLSMVKVALSADHTQIEMWQAHSLIAGIAYDVVVAWGGTVNRMFIDIVEVYDAADSVSDTGSSIASTPTDQIDCPAFGAIIGAASLEGASAAAWTNLNEHTDRDIETATIGTAASAAFAAAQTNLAITCTPTGPINSAMVVASWGQA